MLLNMMSAPVEKFNRDFRSKKVKTVFTEVYLK
jgi:hypothetical protein